MALLTLRSFFGHVSKPLHLDYHHLPMMLIMSMTLRIFREGILEGSSQQDYSRTQPWYFQYPTE